jgi:hypothetical protein
MDVIILTITEEDIEEAYRNAKPPGGVHWAIHSCPIKVVLERMGYEMIDVASGEIRSHGKTIGKLTADARIFHLHFLYSASGIIVLDENKKAAAKHLAGTAGRKEPLVKTQSKYQKVKPTSFEVEIDEELVRGLRANARD